MLRYIVLVAMLSTVVAKNKTTPLNVALWDLFGDTWMGARFYLEKADGFMYDTAPDCEHNPRLVRIMPTISGLYYLVVNTPNNVVPQESWEIFWTATVGDHGEKHSGQFNSSMVWHYEATTDTWMLAYFNGLLNNTKACDACGDAKQCKPKPPPKPQGGDDKNETSTSDNDNDNDNDSAKMEAPKKKYGPPAVNLEVTMYDEESDGWWMDNYLGSSWYIYDNLRNKLFHQGTLCDGSSGVCKLCLGDGPYIFRATGEKSVLFQEGDWVVVDHKLTHSTEGTEDKSDEFYSWDFCGTRGHYSEELKFHVKKGKCIPDYIRTLEDICEDVRVHANITVHGSIALNGVASEIFDAADAGVVVSTLVQEISGLQASNVAILSTSLGSSLDLSSGRRLSAYSHVVNFEVTLATTQSINSYGITQMDIDHLTSSLQTTLETKIASGGLLSTMTSVAASSAVPAMSAVSSVTLLSFELSSVSYSGGREMQLGKTMSSETVVETGSSAAYDFSAIAFFLAAVGVGVIALVGVFSHRVTRYSKLVQESTHEISEISMALEMDNSMTQSNIRSVAERPQISL